MDNRPLETTTRQALNNNGGDLADTFLHIGYDTTRSAFNTLHNNDSSLNYTDTKDEATGEHTLRLRHNQLDLLSLTFDKNGISEDAKQAWRSEKGEWVKADELLPPVVFYGSPEKK